MALLVRPTSLLRSGIVLKPSTLLGFHKAMSKQEYRMLFSPNRRRKPGPKGPSAKLIHAVVEMKQRNSNWGGLSANRSTDGLGVPHPNRQRRSSQDSRPSPPAGPGFRWSLLADFPGPHERQPPLEYRSIQVRVGRAAVPLGPGGHGSVHAPDHWIRCPCGNGRWCRTLSDVQPRHSRPILQYWLPEYLSSDDDPLYRFHQWQANLRILEVTQIKSIPYVPLSHPFAETLIDTVRREYLDHTLFWTTADLENKLLDFRTYFNNHRMHISQEGRTPDTPVSRPVANLRSFQWFSGNHTVEPSIRHRWPPDLSKTRARCGSRLTSANT